MKYLVLTLAFLVSLSLFSQEQASVRGTILDKEMFNEPLLFAKVQVKDTPIKVQTNFHGNFEIDGLDPGEHTLIVSYLGYETLELVISVDENRTTEVISELQAKTIDMQDIAQVKVNSNQTIYLASSSDKRTQ
jgi:hypothetical protein